MRAIPLRACTSLPLHLGASRTGRIGRLVQPSVSSECGDDGKPQDRRLCRRLAEAAVQTHRFTQAKVNWTDRFCFSIYLPYTKRSERMTGTFGLGLLFIKLEHEIKLEGS